MGNWKFRWKDIIAFMVGAILTGFVTQYWDEIKHFIRETFF
jgi:hypothetical protein